MVNRIIKNRKGWIEIVEVFIAILLLTGILLLTIKEKYPRENETALEIAEIEYTILRDIELNNTLRAEILSVTPPVEWVNFNTNLAKVKNKIETMSPSNLECAAKICNLTDICILEEFSGRSIYAESVVISADINTYSPRQLKMFCREK